MRKEEDKKKNEGGVREDGVRGVWESGGGGGEVMEKRGEWLNSSSRSGERV